MSSKQTIFTFSCLAVMLLTGAPASGQAPQFGRPVQIRGGGRVADLKTQLEFGLRARRPLEFRFIDRVVQLVNKGVLPEQLVLETFHWARKKNYRYPFPYFARALTIRAQRLGTQI